MRRLLILVLLVVGTNSPAPRGTMAYLTSAATNQSSNVFTAATIALDATDTGTNAVNTSLLLGTSVGATGTGTLDASMSPATAGLVGAMAVKNSGSARMGYYLGFTETASSGTIPIKPLLDVFAFGSTATASSGCTTGVTSGTTGATVVATGVTAYGSGSIISSTSPRALDVGNSEVLCFHLTIPTYADPLSAGSSAYLQLTFTGKQAVGIIP